MIPFSTTVLVAGEYVEYRISLGDDHYMATLVHRPLQGEHLPGVVQFWQEGKTWVSTTPGAGDLVSLLGIAVEIYLFKATAYESFS